ncbi:hypothetical protein [Allokutzneria sp. NRRL B-24872]|uniref:hypothetical protein n=1 Tax=Allokutzneria sp. NRRL B-24872 TaxID=1137961 RepID=UPI000A3A6D80|nr:hypothetical protein [Allokutzneria sp. NRRL B-24872]
MKIGKSFAVVAVAIAMVFAATPSAFAGGSNRSCGYDHICRLEGGGFPGGTVSIDVDVIGGANRLVEWRYKGDNGFRCGTTFWVNDPPKSWVCHGADPGGYRLIVSDTEYHDGYRLGIRW